jgi:nucleoid DNA-binding protein
MDIVLNLKKFFAEQQDEAAIPGLGVFYKATTADTGNPLPNGKTVILFIEKTPRSNAFVNFLGYEENLTENEAVEVIERWVSSILNDLKTKKISNIPELGSFEIKKDRVVFKPSANQNSYTPQQEEYGLEGFPKQNTSTGSAFEKTEKPIEKTQSGKQKMDPMMLWAIIGAAVILLVGSVIATYHTNPKFRFWVAVQTYKMQSSFKEGYESARKQKAQPIVIIPVTPEVEEIFEDEIFDQIPQQPSETVEKPEVAQTKQPEKKSAQPTPSTQKPATSQLPFKVIGGAFGIKTNADNFSAEMKQEGYQVEVIFDRQRQMHLVSLGAFRTMDEALEFKAKIRTTKGIGTWVFKQH